MRRFILQVHASRAAAMALVLISVLALVAQPPSAAASSAPSHVSNQPGVSGDAPTIGLLVTTVSQGDALRRAVLATPGVRSVAAVAPQVTRLAVHPAAQDAVTRRVAAMTGVVAVEEERFLAFQGGPDDPRFPEQWSHRSADAAAGWELTTGSGDRLIAIVDSGVDARHPDLVERVIAQEVVRSDVNGAPVVRPAGAGGVDNDECGFGHGTNVAGVAAATGNNGLGVAGVAWGARVVDIALTSRTADGTDECRPSDSRVIAALARLASSDFQMAYGRADVVNLSLGGIEPGGRCPNALQSAIDLVVGQGTVVVAAAGNHGNLAFSVPAGCSGVISVGATGSNGARAGYSGLARSVDLTAPGGAQGSCSVARCILTTTVGGGYASVSGTSFSAPYVSGAVALLRDIRPDLTPAQIESVLEHTAVHPRGPGSHDEAYGWGALQIGPALRLADGDEPVTQPRVHPALRMSAGTGTTTAVTQAVATSRTAFPTGGAAFAVLARDDDFADALAGSSLTYGRGPLLFARRTGPLPDGTAAELSRVLRPAAEVYILGGGNALDPGLDEDIRALGLEPVRLAGPTREGTAVAVARRLRTELERRGITSAAVALANRNNWPDAVAVGSIGAALGVPILLTDADTLHPETAGYLRELRAQPVPPERVYVVGGRGVIGDAAAAAAADAASAPGIRLGGAARDATAIAVAAELRRIIAPDEPQLVIAIDLDRADGFAHALAASALAGRKYSDRRSPTSMFVPIRGPSAGERLTDETVRAYCGLGGDPVLAGDVDLLPEPIGDELAAVLDGTASRCPR